MVAGIAGLDASPVLGAGDAVKLSTILEVRGGPAGVVLRYRAPTKVRPIHLPSIHEHAISRAAARFDALTRAPSGNEQSGKVVAAPQSRAFRSSPPDDGWRVARSPVPPLPSRSPFANAAVGPDDGLRRGWGTRPVDLAMHPAAIALPPRKPQRFARLHLPLRFDVPTHPGLGGPAPDLARAGTDERPGGPEGLAASVGKSGLMALSIVPPVKPVRFRRPLLGMPGLERQEDRRPPWRRFAAAAPQDRDRPWIVIIIDDLGVARGMVRRSLALPAPVTLSLMSYADNLERIAADARGRGHEVMLHLPMEPEDRDQDPGEAALLLSLPAVEIEARLEWALQRFGGYVGVNNHMGSRFTSSRPAIRRVMRALSGRGLLFVDSLTSPDSVAAEEARAHGLPTAARDVFIDHDMDPSAIAGQLAMLEAIALRRGYAIGIAHPKPMTLDFLEPWLRGLPARGFALAPVSAVVERPRIEEAFAEASD